MFLDRLASPALTLLSFLFLDEIVALCRRCRRRRRRTSGAIIASSGVYFFRRNDKTVLPS